MKQVIIAGLFLAGCVVQRPVSSLRAVESETPRQCDEACGAMGMVMTAVVLVSNRAGCVCERSPSSAPRAGGALANAAGTIIAIEEEAQQRQQQAQQPYLAPPYTPPPYVPPPYIPPPYVPPPH